VTGRKKYKREEDVEAAELYTQAAKTGRHSSLAKRNSLYFNKNKIIDIVPFNFII
jgi:hypothetical protein